jgi:hypothetical protein
MDLTPEEIYQDFRDKNINENTTFELLTSLIENSENEDIRLEALMNLEKSGIIKDNLFNILENLIISDSNSNIRVAATKFLKDKFLKEALNPLKWAMNHELDYECLIIIIQTLEKINTDESKSVLGNGISKILNTKYHNKERRIENKKFRKVIKRLLKKKQLENFTHTELAEILINYITITLLINQYPNVYYEVDPQNGLIRELDLSNYLEYEVKGTPFGWKNNIKSISEISGLKSLKYLKKIDLSNNIIENVKEIVHLKNLTHLILTNNNISEIDNLEYIKSLSNIKYLDLRGNNLGKKMDPTEFDSNIKVLLKDSYIKIK